MLSSLPATVNPWITLISTTLTSLATVTIAWFVARISKRNAETAREKLRLDLYDRRYAIFKGLRDFQADLLLWHGDAEQVARSRSFTALFEEAEFLFPPASGITEYLQEMHNRASFIVRYKAKLEAYSGAPEEQVRLAKERSDHVNWLLGSLPELAKRMKPYLKFHSI